MTSSIHAEKLEAERLADRRQRAMVGALRAVEALRELGVGAELTGSLAEGDFGSASDVDLLVTHCPRSLKYAIESVVEERLEGFTFDVIYLDELSPARAKLHRRPTRDVGT